MRLVADANVLLSAVLGGRAKLVLAHANVEDVFTADAVLAEVQEYASYLAAKKRIPLDTLLLTVATLPVTVVTAKSTPRVFPKPKGESGAGIRMMSNFSRFDFIWESPPVWSNDNDFEDAGVEWYTTAEVLRKLG